MKAVLAYPRMLAGVVAGIVIGLFAGGLAYAVTSNVFRYSHPQTGWYGIHAAALSPDTSARTYTTLYNAGSLASTSTGCFQTGLELPDNANLVQLSAWYEATVPAGVWFWIFRNKLGSGAGDDVTKVLSANTSGGRVSEVFPLTATIDNRAYTYGLAVCLKDSNSVFFGARITYKYTTAGD